MYDSKEETGTPKTLTFSSPGLCPSWLGAMIYKAQFLHLIRCQVTRPTSGVMQRFDDILDECFYLIRPLPFKPADGAGLHILVSAWFLQSKD